MRLTVKKAVFIALIALILGHIPSIAAMLGRNVSFSLETGLLVNTELSAALKNIAGVIREYSWHIIFAYTIVIGFVIFMENQNPDRTILWLITLALLPGLGLLIYFIMGPELSYQKKIRPNKFPPQLQYAQPGVPCDNRRLLERLLYSAGNAEVMQRNEIKVFTDGADKFAALKEDLKNAVLCINMQYFIFKDDEVGLEIGDILAEKAREGLKVRLLYDAVGSWKLNRSFIRRLMDAGVECHSFMPMSFPRLRGKMNFRNHRKIVVVDNTVAYTGGFNIGAEYIGKGHLGEWRDTHVRLEGDAVQELNGIFLRDWCFRSGMAPSPATEALADFFCGPPGHKKRNDIPLLPMQAVTSGIDSPWHPISQGYFNMIARARERVWITSPYLVPGASFIKAITNTSLAGVDVRILLPSTKDHFLVFWGSRSNYENLLRAGVRIFLYEKGFIHSKTVLSDGETVSVGSCNMDARSLDINFENQLFIYDKELNAEFAGQFEKDTEASREIVLEEWMKRPLRHKIIESFARLYSSQI